MTNEELEQYHRIAMDNSELALIALREGDFERFRQLSADAFHNEKKAALGLYDQEIEPSRSVLFRSAAYIALDNANFTEAQKLYEYALEGEVPEEIKTELEELKVEIDRIKAENEDLRTAALLLLKRQPAPVSKEDIINAVAKRLGAFDEKEINLEYIYEYLERQFSIGADKHTTIEEDFEPWIHNKKGAVEMRFWDRYIKYQQVDENWAPDTTDKLDDITDDILNHLKDPTTSGSWDKRGMVVGQVQSGKTSNYIGLMCKAADYGYKIIVVLAGITNDLRSQTQLRTDIGFLGRDTQVDRPGSNESRNFGVSKYDSRPQAHYFTSSAMDGDFKTTARYITGTNPRSGNIVVVVKKHSTVLKEFIKWFADWGDMLPDGKKIVRGLPLLLIDDEADNGSVNISAKSISTINGLIRSLLSLFEKSAYVGYTATPFANVFIPLTEGEDYASKGLNIQLPKFWEHSGKDLFPKDFIINIPPPSNYTGPKEIFGIDGEISADPEKAEKGLPLVRPLLEQDYQRYFSDEHGIDDELPDALPDNLAEAIKSFILVCAIRRARGQINVHNSMLVHVTLYVRWQNKIASLITRQLKFYQQQIRQRQGKLIDELRELYKRDFIPTTAEIVNMPEFEDSSVFSPDWFEIETQLRKAASKIQVRAIHGDTTQEGLDFDNVTSLDYYDYRRTGLSVIAVGGNKLSRGLTLEGLSVSYYLRATKMYDTLMQMGRWFGYRPGYVDLCRLYTSEELIKWYKYITVASEELRADFEEMKRQRKSPRNFGLKVRQHPDVLKITATNKMRSSQEMELTFSDKLRETWCFSRNSAIVSGNFKHTSRFINSLGIPREKNEQPFVWYRESNSSDVVRFLDGYKADDRLEHQKITEYIREQAKVNFLTNWTIVLISNQKNKKNDLFKANGEYISVGLTMRTDAAEGKGNYYEIIKSHIIDPRHEFVDFDVTSEAYNRALQLTIEDWRKSERKKKRPDPPDIPSGKNIRPERPVTEGLLLIYPLDPKPKGWENSPLKEPVIGYAISFPRNEDDKKLKYKVNKVFREEYNYTDEPETQEEEMEE